ncbi:MAG: hypothetical protein D9V46_03775 [Deltaproteobacteria bacterium]|uniref:hypothetical protein n=1 Tax=Hydrosulfovibrio ferrireducens TaxID=2934181 RepID=UPI001216CC60|nr:MAG: hypothetical protein D9V46_03775 [Deltaproteobacteria bacterium]
MNCAYRWAHDQRGGSVVSVSYAAVRIFCSLRDTSVLLVEAREMAELAVEHLVRQMSGPDKEFSEQ